jgi:TP901-1 family phage major tail protein
MADGDYYSGRLVTVKRGDAGTPSEAFTAIAALRANTISFSEATVDTTNKDSAGVRELLDGKILNAVTVSGTGMFTDDASMQNMFTDFNTGNHSNYEIDIVPTATTGGDTYTGAFRVTALEFVGEHDGAAQYSITLESSGGVTASA